MFHISDLWGRTIEGHCTSFRSKIGTTFPMVTNVTTDLLSTYGYTPFGRPYNRLTYIYDASHDYPDPSPAIAESP